MRRASKYMRPSMAGGRDWEQRLDGRLCRRLTSPSSTAEHRSSHPRRKSQARMDSSSTCPFASADSCCSSASACFWQTPGCTSRPGRRKYIRPMPRFLTSLITTPSGLLAIILLLSLACRPASAVQIKYTNCLPDSVQSQQPPFLQWVPVEAHAKFDTQNDAHNFQFIVWGNVTGSVNKQMLPPPTSPDWTNDNKTDGKIVNSENDANGTTVKSSIGMLTYTPWSSRSFFCEQALVGGHCPLAPVFNTTGKV